MTTPFRLTPAPASSVHNRPPPAPAPNPMSVYNGAAAAGVDMQTYAATLPPVHDHDRGVPWPAAKPGAPNPMRMKP